MIEVTECWKNYSTIYTQDLLREGITYFHTRVEVEWRWLSKLTGIRLDER